MSYLNPTATELALLGHARTIEQARLKLVEAMRLFGARDEWPALDDVVADAAMRLAALSRMKRELHAILRTRNHESLLARAHEVMDRAALLESALRRVTRDWCVVSTDGKQRYWCRFCGAGNAGQPQDVRHARGCPVLVAAAGNDESPDEGGSMTDARAERWKDAEVLHEWRTPEAEHYLLRRDGRLYHRATFSAQTVEPTHVHAVVDVILAEEILRLRKVLGIAERALEDLGACNDGNCTEPNCLHALVVVRRALVGEENRDEAPEQ